MNSIKFSHDYPKLWKQTEAELIAVRFLKTNERNESLVIYDTVMQNGAFYSLPPGDLVQLIFIGNLNIPFCTLRSPEGRYGDKHKYYSEKIGQKFKIEITEKVSS